MTVAELQFLLGVKKKKTLPTACADLISNYCSTTVNTFILT
jgi:hypothetical protein